MQEKACNRCKHVELSLGENQTFMRICHLYPPAPTVMLVAGPNGPQPQVMCAQPLVQDGGWCSFYSPGGVEEQ